VIGEGARPIAGATIEVLGAQPPCVALSGADGTFSFNCAASGRRVVQARQGGLVPWRSDEVMLEPLAELHLNFLLKAQAAPPALADESWLEDPLPNPVLGAAAGHPITLRAFGVVLAVVGFVLGAVLMVGVGRHLRVEKQRLSSGEVADLVMNAGRPLGQRLAASAAGTAGAQVTVSYGADELAAALVAGRMGVVAVALLAPLLVGVAVVGFALAALVGQPRYLFGGMMLVAAGFVIVPVIITVQAVRKSRRVVTDSATAAR
jgi:hypothetical protein